MKVMRENSFVGSAEDEQVPGSSVVLYALFRVRIMLVWYRTSLVLCWMLRAPVITTVIKCIVHITCRTESPLTGRSYIQEDTLISTYDPVR